MEKVLFIICDGLSDRPLKELGGKTPLEAALKPNLDKLTSSGLTGIMHTVDIGVRPGSDVAHLSLFGYDPAIYYPGRGPFEAAGYGARLLASDVALRANFATVDSDLVVVDRRADRIDDTQALVSSLNNLTIEKVKILVKQGVGHRAAVVLRGKNLDSHVTDVDPHKENIKILSARATVKNKAALHTAKIINLFTQKSYQILNNHPFNIKRVKTGKKPANILLLRGAGKIPRLPSFSKKYGLKAACIAGAGLYKGIASLLGMTVIPVVGATGKPDSDIAAKISKAIESFTHYDFIFVHIKGADVLSEDGDFMGKKEFIEKIDHALALVLNMKDLLIVITADHSTSSYLKMHTADPVPLLITGENIHTDHVSSFGERSAASGKLGHIQGKHLMPIILDLLGRAPLYGA